MTRFKANNDLLLIGGAAVALFVLHAGLFVFGFRSTADDVKSYAVWMEGWQSIQNLSYQFAVEQGRIGHFLMTPLNALGSAVAGHLWGRVLQTVLHFGVYFVFAVYWARLMGRREWALPLLIVLVMLCLNPVAYEHMPPNAYPLQNTLPIILIVLARLYLFDFRYHRMSARLLVYAVILLCSILTEYVFLFYTFLIAAEYGMRFFQRRQGCQVTVALPTTKLVADLSVVVLYVLAYVGFRLSFPSQYVGNQIDSAIQWAKLGYTTLHHILAGTGLYRVSYTSFPSLDALSWGLVGLVFILTAGLAYWLARKAEWALSQIPLLFTASAAIFLMLYITLPVSMVAKYQLWCHDQHVCGYLDGRLSFVGIGMLVVSGVAVGLRFVEHEYSKRFLIGFFALLLGVSSSLTWMQNLVVSRQMLEDAKVWGRAETLACHPQTGGTPNELLASRIDPTKRIAFHPWMKRSDFWRQYVDQHSGSCPSILLEESLFPSIEIDKVYGFQSGAYGKFLGKGWSYPEPGAIWTEQAKAEIHFRLPKESLSATPQLLVVGRPYFGPSVRTQRVTVRVNGEFGAEWAFVPESFDPSAVLFVPLAGVSPEQEVTVEFTIHHPRIRGFPGESSDWRALGFALGYMRLQR